MTEIVRAFILASLAVLVGCAVENAPAPTAAGAMEQASGNAANTSEFVIVRLDNGLTLDREGRLIIASPASRALFRLEKDMSETSE